MARCARGAQVLAAGVRAMAIAFGSFRIANFKI
jgi:hypothetical protein